MVDFKQGTEIFDAPPISLSEGNITVLRNNAAREQAMREESCIVYPDNSSVVSNRVRNNKILYVPGIRTKDFEISPGVPQSEAIYAARQIVTMRGKQVEFVSNHTEGYLIDLSKCAACALSKRLGSMAERSAVSHVIRFLDEQIKGGDFPVEIYAHSQGNEVTDVALGMYAEWLQSKGYNENQVKDLFKNITIYRYGSPEDNAPSSKTFVFENTRDPVTKLRPLIDSKNCVLDLFKGELRRQSNVIQVRVNHGDEKQPLFLPVDIDAHSIIAYLKNNDQYYDKSHRCLTPQGKAAALFRSIQAGFFTDAESDQRSSVKNNNSLS